MEGNRNVTIDSREIRIDAWTSCGNINLIFHKTVQLKSQYLLSVLPLFCQIFLLLLFNQITVLEFSDGKDPADRATIIPLNVLFLSVCFC